MSARRVPTDWWVLATWVAILGVSCLIQTYVEIADDARRGVVTAWSRAFATEATSHLVVAALVPAVYFAQRRFPLNQPRNLAVHVVVLVLFSVAHTVGMGALRLLWFAGILGEDFRFPITFARLGYEFTKDIFSYIVINTGILAFQYVRQRQAAAGLDKPSQDRPERFAVRKRGGTEVMVDVADIDWIEAAGNYAILHVGSESYEIRSSLARLEAELDPKRFVRVHKSHVVNILRVTEVTPWVSGDWRIRLAGGAEVNLSRRYRQRFEALAPVRS